MKLNQREQSIFFITIIFVVFYIFYQFLYLPKTRQIEAISAACLETRSNLLIATNKIKALEQLESLNHKIEIPPRETQIEMIYNHISKKLDMEIMAVVPSVQDNKLLIKIVCDGDFKPFSLYLESLKELKLPIQVDSVLIAESVKGLKFELTLSSYI